MLAQYRCDEISAEVYGIFHGALKDTQRSLESAVVDDFGSKAGLARDNALESFDKVAHRYNNSVYKKKRAELATKIEDFLTSLFTMQLRNLIKKVNQTFEATFQVLFERFVLFGNLPLRM